MLKSWLHYWCIVVLCSTMFSSAFYIQSLTTELSSSQDHMLQSVEAGDHPSPISKRSSEKNFGSFYRLMARHNRYKDEQAFVEKMFRLFDMNSDQVIERDEFRAILQLLGIISHAY